MLAVVVHTNRLTDVLCCGANCARNEYQLFLEILSSNALSDWPSDMKKARDEYTALRAKFTSNPAAVEGDLKVNNPLSTAKDNTWQSYFADNDLMEVIKLDIKRTHQENEFFIKPETQSIMLNILFTWAKQNPAYGYRQGMNELLAPIILAVNRDSRPVDSTKTDTASLLLDKRFVEHDTFCIFEYAPTHQLSLWLLELLEWSDGVLTAWCNVL